MIGAILMIVFGSILLVPFVALFLVVLIGVLSEIFKCDSNDDLAALVALLIVTIAGAALLWGGIVKLP